MSEIALVNNAEGRMADADIEIIGAALALQLTRFCEAWGFAQPVVSFYPVGTTPPETAWQIAFVDKADVSGAEAYHTVNGGRPDGIVFAGYLLDNGSKVLEGPNSVASACSHEVLELLRDERCTLWVEIPLVAPDGKQYTRIAAEVCDPVQAGIDLYEVSGRQVTLSAYVLPDWEDPTSGGPYSSDGSAMKAGEVTPGGYAEYQAATGEIAQVFGERVAPHVTALKQNCGRRKRRML